MSPFQRFLAFDELTFIEWRWLDGDVLQTALLSPSMRTPLLLADVRSYYDVYARPNDGEWRLIYRVRTRDSGALIVDWVQP